MPSQSAATFVCKPALINALRFSWSVRMSDGARMQKILLENNLK